MVILSSSSISKDDDAEQDVEGRQTHPTTNYARPERHCFGVVSALVDLFEHFWRSID